MKLEKRCKKIKKFFPPCSIDYLGVFYNMDNDCYDFYTRAGYLLCSVPDYNCIDLDLIKKIYESLQDVVFDTYDLDKYKNFMGEFLVPHFSFAYPCLPTSIYAYSVKDLKQKKKQNQELKCQNTDT